MSSKCSSKEHTRESKRDVAEVHDSEGSGIVGSFLEEALELAELDALFQSHDSASSDSEIFCQIVDKMAMSYIDSILEKLRQAYDINLDRLVMFRYLKNATRNLRFVQRLQCKIWSEYMATEDSSLFDHRAWFNFHSKKGLWRPHIYRVLAPSSELRVVRHVLAPILRDFRTKSISNMFFIMIDTSYMKYRLLSDARIKYGLFIDSSILINEDGGGILKDWDIGSEARMYGDQGDKFWADYFRN